jgi:hypothetical protein
METSNLLVLHNTADNLIRGALQAQAECPDLGWLVAKATSWRMEIEAVIHIRHEEIRSWSTQGAAKKLHAQGCRRSTG